MQIAGCVWDRKSGICRVSFYDLKLWNCIHLFCSICAYPKCSCIQILCYIAQVFIAKMVLLNDSNLLIKCTWVARTDDRHSVLTKWYVFHGGREFLAVRENTKNRGNRTTQTLIALAAPHTKATGNESLDSSHPFHYGILAMLIRREAPTFPHHER